VRCTEGLDGMCTPRTNLVGRSTRFLSEAEIAILQTVPTWCTRAPPPVCVGPEAETTGDPGTCDERLENFGDGTPASRDVDAHRLFYTEANSDGPATQIECEGDFRAAQCTDTDETGNTQYCLPECTRVLVEGQTCDSLDLTNTDECSDYAEQYSPFVLFQGGQDLFFAEDVGSMTASAWHRQCKPNTDSNGAPCVSSEHNWGSTDNPNPNPSTCLPPRPPLYTNPGVTCSAISGNVQYNVVVTSHITEPQFVGSAGVSRGSMGSRIIINRPDVPAAKCCTHSSALNCYGQTFSEDQKETGFGNPFEHTYSCCHYVDDHEAVVCTQTGSMSCRGAWMEPNGLTDGLPPLALIDNFWAPEFELDQSKLAEYCMTPSLYLETHVLRLQGSTYEDLQGGIKRALFDSLFSVRAINSMFDMIPEGVIAGSKLSTELAGGYTMELFFRDLREYAGFFQTDEVPIGLYQQDYYTLVHHLKPCVARTSRVECEQHFEAELVVPTWSSASSFRHCVWSPHANGACHQGNDCLVTV